MKSKGSVKINTKNYELWEETPDVFNLEVTTIDGDYCFSAGLWFESNTLVDYDGVFQLSKSMIKAIRRFGFKVPNSFLI